MFSFMFVRTRGFFGGCGSGGRVKVNLQCSDRRLAVKPTDTLIVYDSLGCKEPRENN